MVSGFDCRSAKSIRRNNSREQMDFLSGGHDISLDFFKSFISSLNRIISKSVSPLPVFPQFSPIPLYAPKDLHPLLRHRRHVCQSYHNGSYFQKNHPPSPAFPSHDLRPDHRQHKQPSSNHPVFLFSASSLSDIEKPLTEEGAVLLLSYILRGLIRMEDHPSALLHRSPT